MDRYTTLAAQELAARKVKIPLSKLIVDPAWTFLKTYCRAAGVPGRAGRADHRPHGGVLHVPEILQGEKHELMRVLHLDTGEEMRGGQWQALRLIEGLARRRESNRVLLARAGSPLGEAARQAGCRVEPAGFARAAILARRCDLVHAHDARSPHPGGAGRRRPAGGLAPGGLRRRGARSLSRWKYGRAGPFHRRLGVREIQLVARGVPAGEDRRGLRWRASARCRPAGRRPPARARAGEPATIPQRALALAREAAQLAGVELQLSGNLQRDLPGGRVFLYITHSEGLGSGALLAMSAGVPVVASRGWRAARDHPPWPERLAGGEPARRPSPPPFASCSTMRPWPGVWARRASYCNGAIHRGTYGSWCHGSLSAGALMIGRSGVSLRAVHWQLPQRVHLSLAAGPVGGAAALALPGMWENHRLVRQHSARELRPAGRPLPPLPARILLRYPVVECSRAALLLFRRDAGARAGRRSRCASSPPR